MPRSIGFPPASSRDARILILGSMPGVPSLQARQYYAHPRNAFWPIMMQTLGVIRAYGAALPGYDERLRHLQRHGIALWDVLQHCERPGSLDASIRRDSMVLNDFSAFLRSHAHIQRICFNGATAAALFERHAAARLASEGLLPPDRRRLPSTSPAHASMSAQDKLCAWQAALNAPLASAASTQR